MTNNRSNYRKFRRTQSGQTLIETLVAIFVLVTGLISATTLAVYSFNSTDAASKQIVATGLAREGIEAIKNIRDSYWLNDTLIDCSGSMGAGQMCYRNWTGTGTNQLKKNSSYSVDFDPQTGNWLLNKQNGNGTPTTFLLNYDSGTGVYSDHNTGVGVPTIYHRKIDIDEDNTPPYSVLDPKLIVISTVWWTSRSCPYTDDPTPLTNSCKVVLQSYLTNWKNY